MTLISYALEQAGHLGMMGISWIRHLTIVFAGPAPK
jgi:hypothetical protein